jgi:LysM repeat protein
MQIWSRPLVVVLGVGVALSPAACSTLTGSGGNSAKNNASDSTVFRTITVELQTSTTQAPQSAGGGNAAAASQTTLDPNIYQVQPGDSWYGIARKLKVDVNALLAANNATTRTVLLPGRRIAKPSAGSTAGGLAPPPPGGAATGAGSSRTQTTPTLAPGSASGSYQIQSGDSWYGIANRLHVSVNALLDANGATTKTVLLVGKYLRVPQG